MKRIDIKYEVMFNIGVVWGENPKLARKMLKKLYFEHYNILDDIEEKRVILQSLITMEKDFGNLAGVRNYVKQLKNDMDSIEGYKETESIWYAKMIPYYITAYKDELSQEELLYLYEYCYATYSECDSDNKYIQLLKLEARFNLALFKSDFNGVFEVIRDTTIHSRKDELKSLLTQSLQCFSKTNKKQCVRGVMINIMHKKKQDEKTLTNYK